MAFSPIGRRDFEIICVNGFNRDPKPPAIITAFICLNPFSLYIIMPEI